MGLIGTTHKIAVPDEDGQWIEVRGLTWSERKAIGRETLEASVKDLSDMEEAFAELERIRGEQPAREERRKPTREEFLQAFHYPAVLERGLITWSYREAVDLEGKPDWERADKRLLDFCVAAILEVSGYDVPDEDGAAGAKLGNFSAPSTGI